MTDFIPEFPFYAKDEGGTWYKVAGKMRLSDAAQFKLDFERKQKLGRAYQTAKQFLEEKAAAKAMAEKKSLETAAEDKLKRVLLRKRTRRMSGPVLLDQTPKGKQMRHQELKRMRLTSAAWLRGSSR